MKKRVVLLLEYNLGDVCSGRNSHAGFTRAWSVDSQ